MISSKKMEGLSSAVFSNLDHRKKELIEKGIDVIDFSIGTPDMPPSPKVVEKLIEECSKSENYKYAINDSEELVNAVINWYDKRYGVELKNHEIVSLLGSQSGFTELALSLINPGDIVLTPDPGYPIFSIGPMLAGAELYKMPLLKENNYLIDFEAIDPEIASRAKLMVVSYPNNPTAAVAPREFYIELVEFAKKYNIIVLHDNAYSELIFDGTVGESFLSIPGAKDIGIEFNSLSKSYSIPGCRIAFAVGNKNIIQGIKTIKSHLDYGMFLPFQKVAVELLSSTDDYVDIVRDTYKKRRDILIDGLNNIGWKTDKSPGSMFVWAPIPSNYSSSLEFTMDLMDKTGVIVVPGSSFGTEGEGFVRIALVENENRILKAIENIKNSGILNTKITETE
ncbi:aminotransferase class I/II-fold pyridoxal phosphate-dependent enzyme [Clostridium sp. DJ247]|uniref:aminotransferase class I/II-fold pyridoxal phosphate-dependent enzyme n=1 Tax=Clostridium sp. DJ247 TaxID=2726188 RepID=UPI0016296B15|nr:aminotransferase class I/II-fold pyridoxal phosphate-dependent enzyme [Clostridium sp. DJ247]MBC2581792.1 aminotransferase class I/II-fold pyridoxal phosphate-dependent enzyme [Clostridium sp. DJ247]